MTRPATHGRHQARVHHEVQRHARGSRRGANVIARGEPGGVQPLPGDDRTFEVTSGVGDVCELLELVGAQPPVGGSTAPGYSPS